MDGLADEFGIYFSEALVRHCAISWGLTIMENKVEQFLMQLLHGELSHELGTRWAVSS